ncbi:hypothetical protein GCM10018772_23030 [Streptomyces fumanus]|uniref:Secreted protein n=1 Tax=Streptomyces fumanus TaxID=67302 RepID=A0A919AEC8_9ACTN|nr:hypothetical protein GCM10018772_23030 [Streptomyces fumanus]
MLKGMAAAPLAGLAGGLVVPAAAHAAPLPTSGYRLTGRDHPLFAPQYPYEGVMRRLAPDLGPAVPLAAVAAAANRTADRVTRWPTPSGDPGRPYRFDVPPQRRLAGHSFRWDADDFTDERWRPQGITQDYDGDGTSPARTLLVSWYARGSARDQGARLTVVNWSPTGAITYRHVLLVEPFTERDDQDELRDDIGATDIHAGGIAWYGDHLYVADSGYLATGSMRVGIRVFDLRRFFKVTRGPGIGRQPDGKTFHAHRYEYVLPQIYGYNWSGTARDLTFSQLSVDRTASGPGLLVSEYATTGAPRLVRWPFLPAGGLRPRAEWAASVPRGVRTQGAVKVGSTYYLTTSNGSRRAGALRTWRSTSGATVRHRSRLNIGCEDLSYDGSGSGALWTLGEYANDVGPDDPRAPYSRYVYAVRP